MSAYNTVVMPDTEQCPSCGSLIRRKIQFKYGDTWQHDYAIGDRITWGGNDIGIRASLVKALGYPEDCPVCCHDLGGVFDVIVRNDVIEDVVRGATRPYIEAGHATYLVVKT